MTPDRSTGRIAHKPYPLNPIPYEKEPKWLESNVSAKFVVVELAARKRQTCCARAKKGTMDKSEVVRKLRQLTPGANVIIEREGLAS